MSKLELSWNLLNMAYEPHDVDCSCLIHTHWHRFFLLGLVLEKKKNVTPWKYLPLLSMFQVSFKSHNTNSPWKPYHLIVELFLFFWPLSLQTCKKWFLLRQWRLDFTNDMVFTSLGSQMTNFLWCFFYSPFILLCTRILFYCVFPTFKIFPKTFKVL